MSLLGLLKFIQTRRVATVFLFIIGFGKTTIDHLGSAGTRVCPNCGNQTEWKLLRVKKWLTLFFVPVFAYKTFETAVCPVCRYGLAD